MKRNPSKLLPRSHLPVTPHLLPIFLPPRIPPTGCGRVGGVCPAATPKTSSTSLRLGRSAKGLLLFECPPACSLFVTMEDNNRISAINGKTASQSDKAPAINGTIASQSDKAPTINRTIASQSDKAPVINGTIASQ